MTRDDYIRKIKNSLAIQRSVQLVGPPGVGKTTLLKKLQQDLQSEGTPCVYFSAREAIIGNGAMFWNRIDELVKGDKQMVLILDDLDAILPGLKHDLAFAVGLEHFVQRRQKLVIGARSPLSSPSAYGARIAQTMKHFIVVPVGPMSREESESLALFLAEQYPNLILIPNFSSVTATASGGIPGVIEAVVKAMPGSDAEVQKAAKDALNDISESTRPDSN